MKILMYIYKPIVWVIMSPLLPFVVLFSEIEKFGKYIHWGRIPLEDAYRLGLDRGFNEGRVHSQQILKELEEKIPPYKQQLLDRFESEIKFIEEKPASWDVDTGEVSSYRETYKVPTMCIRIEVGSKNEYLSVPGRSELYRMIGRIV